VDDTTGKPHGESDVIPPHGGFRKLLSFQKARLIYDVTVLFCDRYVERGSRTRDQMVQAARSGAQNIAEGSQASGTTKKIEINLTNIARSSLEELRLDYEDFLRHHGLPQLPADHPSLMRLKAKRPDTLEEVRAWVRAERGRAVGDVQGQPGTDAEKLLSSAALAANGALTLLNLCCHLLDRQVASQAAAFEKDGGFSERLYRIRKKALEKRRRSRKPPDDPKPLENQP